MTYTDIHTIIRQLCDWHTHREPYTHETNGTTWAAHHITSVPPLITQLLTANPADTGNSAGKPASRPPTSLDALDTYTFIDLAAARWVRELGEDDPADTIACIRALYGLAASAHYCGKSKAVIEEVKDEKTGHTRKKVVCCTVHDIERDIRHWWTQARIVSGWDTAAWAPNNTCPMCTKRRTLRIRPDDQTAMCTGCRETWDRANIGLLAEHVRQENGDEQAAS
jgi:hypothetical protein